MDTATFAGPQPTAAGTRRCPACAAASSTPSRRTMLSCRTCGSISVGTMPSPDELSRYYNSDYTVAQHGLTPRRRADWTPLIELAEPVVRGRRGLEVGSSAGDFLRLAAERGWSMGGVELDDRARCRHSEASPGIPAWRTIDAARAAGCPPADAVWMLHTIEHFADPRQALGDAGRALRPGGVLIISTPNAASLQARLLGRGWEWSTPPAHLVLFSPQGLSALLESTGFHVERVLTRRGDSTGLLANALLAPLRIARRRRASRRQRISQASGTQRLSAAINRAYDPLSAPLRAFAYRRNRGPELLIAATRR